MKTKNQNINIAFLLAITIFTTACSSTNYKIVNDRVSEGNRKKVFTKEKAECHKKAIEVVSYSPSVVPNNNIPAGTSEKYTFRDQYGRLVGSATSETTIKRNNGTVLSGFNEARARSENRRNSYGNRVAQYRKACLQAKGWRKVQLTN